MGFFGGGAGGGGASTPEAKATVDAALQSPVAFFKDSGCPYCKQAETVLKKNKASYTAIQVDPAIRAELKKRTKRTSVPAIFIKGTFYGGMNDGGKFGGLAGLESQGMLMPLLEGAGAIKGFDWKRNTPLAPLFGNNLRNALGSMADLDDK